MSSNPHTIHLGNYEEFFLLYIDGELTAEDAAAVDAFVAAHPDLRAELELLDGTRLTPEPLSFPKEELLAHNMERSVIGEELFLYMDNELSGEEKARVEEALNSKPAYRRQLDELLLTRLDATQAIPYPGKKELYRREERRAAFPWLRAAAVVAAIALGGFLYLNRTTDKGTGLAHIDTEAPKATPLAAPGTDIKSADPSPSIHPTNNKNSEQTLARTDVPAPRHDAVHKANVDVAQRANRTTDHDPVQRPAVNNGNDLAQSQPADGAQRPKELVASLTQAHDNRLQADALKPALVAAAGINNSPVTFALQNRNTTNEATTQAPTNPADVAAGNDHKGSVKGFLRRATRLIEKRTGIDPTNDGELLIGVVALKLK